MFVAVLIGTVLTVYDPWSCLVTFGAASVSSMSMQPTLITRDNKLINDRVAWLKNAYRNDSPRRGDIVVVPSNGSPIHGLHLRRVAGLPCETIRVDPPWLIANGCAVSDPPLFQAISQCSNGYTGFTPPGSYGNNSSNVTCSPYEVKLGSNGYFLLGDNSAHALDSRYYGPVQRGSIPGRAKCIVWPINRICDL